MATPKPDSKAVDQCISQFSGEARARLEKVRQLIRDNAPDAIEKMSYDVPAFYLVVAEGRVVIRLVLINLEVKPVVTRQSVLGANPYETSLIPHNSLSCVFGQTIRCCKMAKAI